MHTIYCKTDTKLSEEEKDVFSEHLNQEGLSHTIWDLFEECNGVINGSLTVKDIDFASIAGSSSIEKGGVPVFSLVKEIKGGLTLENITLPSKERELSKLFGNLEKVKSIRISKVNAASINLPLLTNLPGNLEILDSSASSLSSILKSLFFILESCVLIGSNSSLTTSLINC